MGPRYQNKSTRKTKRLIKLIKQTIRPYKNHGKIECQIYQIKIIKQAHTMQNMQPSQNEPRPPRPQAQRKNQKPHTPREHSRSPRLYYAKILQKFL